ncbi:MAG: DUF308 domain-containing protein [Bacilli bacterium]|nr:DUF308 domain-containing protein [Bacilli bacterium]
MGKKFDKLMNISLITSIIFILIGIVLLFFTKISLEIIAYVIAGILILNGVFNIIDDYKQFKIFYFFDGFTSGLLSIILGIIIIVNQNYIAFLIPLAVGLWFIISSTFKLRMALALKDANNSNWVTTYILSLLTIIVGLCLIFNPEIAALSLTKVIGALSIIYSICDIIGAIIFKNNIKAIRKVFE